MGEASTQNIPKELICEMVDGKPIYYRGYLDYLNGSKQFEEIMSRSLKQALIITQLIILLANKLNPKLTFLTNEVGLQFAANSWRSADFTLYSPKPSHLLPILRKQVPERLTPDHQCR